MVPIQLMPKSTEKLDSLQLIRGIAMLLVLFIHVDTFSSKILNQTFLFGLFSPGGDAGVDMFFVLSGFIIFYVHKQDIGQKLKFFPYLIKRFSRIYPTYWVVTLLVIPLHFLFPQFGLGDETQFGRILNSFFLIPSTRAPIIHAAWTLVNEMLFYLSFSLLIYFGFKKLRPFIFAVIVLTTIGWFYSINNIASFQSSLLYVFFSYHNFEFLLGVLGAFLVLKKKIKFKKEILIFGVLLLASTILFEHFQNRAFYPLRLFGFGIPSFLIITGLSAFELGKSYRAPKNILYKILLFFGNASFSIYLTHQILISGIGRILLALKIPDATLIIISTITLTIIFGSVFHIFIEKPLMSISRKKLLSYYQGSLH